MTRKAKESWAAELGTTLGYLQKLAGGHCMPSVEMLLKITRSDPRIGMHDFKEAHDERLAMLAEKKKAAAKAPAKAAAKKVAAKKAR